jgi:hypothetical protein
MMSNVKTNPRGLSARTQPSLTSGRLYLEPTVIQTGTLEPRWDAIELASARSVGIRARAGYDCIDAVRSALLNFTGEARGD